MTRICVTLALFGLLAACGADGAPERPKSGISGEARIGVVLN
jgi:hypothetical protein